MNRRQLIKSVLGLPVAVGAAAVGLLAGNESRPSNPWAYDSPATARSRLFLESNPDNPKDWFEHEAMAALARQNGRSMRSLKWQQEVLEALGHTQHVAPLGTAWGHPVRVNPDLPQIRFFTFGDPL